MKRRRVKITGIGPVTPAGIGREAFWRGILEPVSRIRPYKRLGDEFGPFVAAAIDRFDVNKYTAGAVLPKGASRQTLFAIAAASLAIEDAGVSRSELCESRCAVITGSCLMDFGGIVATVDAGRRQGRTTGLPRTVHTTGVGSVPTAINDALGLSGRTVAVSNQCSSGIDAIGYAATLISSGEIDIAICGGTDAPLHRTPLLEMRSGELISSSVDMPDRQARPFDLWRTAGVIGEGCCMFVVEAEGSRRDGYSYIRGYGFANDENGEICSGMVDATRISLAQALIHKSEIDVINAWGPGDKRVDKGEVKSMKNLFGTQLAEIAAVSIKGAIGSPLGGAPAIQVASAALGQRFETIPPTVNWEYPDPDCCLNLSRQARPIPHRFTLINTHGLGAVNGSLILERC